MLKGRKCVRLLSIRKGLKVLKKGLEMLLRVALNRRSRKGKKITVAEEKSSMDYDGLKVEKKKKKD